MWFFVWDYYTLYFIHTFSSSLQSNTNTIVNNGQIHKYKQHVMLLGRSFQSIQVSSPGIVFFCFRPLAYKTCVWIFVCFHEMYSVHTHILITIYAYRYYGVLCYFVYSPVCARMNVSESVGSSENTSNHEFSIKFSCSTMRFILFYFPHGVWTCSIQSLLFRCVQSPLIFFALLFFDFFVRKLIQKTRDSKKLPLYTFLFGVKTRIIYTWFALSRWKSCMLFFSHFHP